MKIAFLLLVLVTAAVSAPAELSNSVPRSYVVALAPGASEEKGNAVLKACFDLALNRAQAGDNIEFLDGLKLTRLASVKVPSGTARERANSPEFAGKFGALKAFLTVEKAEDSRLQGQLRLPQLFDRIAQDTTADRQIIVLVVGSPLFRTIEPKEEAFNMDSGLIPGDGMLLASRAESLFGVNDRKGRFSGTPLYWLTSDDNWGSSEMHRAAVERFWSLFASGQGAVLCAMTSDVASAFDHAVRGGLRPLINAVPNLQDRGLTMRPAVTFHREATPTSAPARVESKNSDPTPLRMPTVISPKAEAPVSPKPNAIIEAQPKTALLTKPATVAQATILPKLVPVILDVVVVDSQHKPVTDLNQGDFRVRENGESQTLTQFTRERLPISIELLVDTSGSIAGKLKKIEAAGASIIRQGRPGDEFAVMEFKASANVVQEFTTEPSDAVSALDRLKAGGETALLDAAKLAVEHANSRATNERKAVVLITDGDERNSRCEREEVLRVLREANVQVYAIGFPDGLPEITMGRQSQGSARKGGGESQAKALLNELASVSGGRSFYPRTTDELDGIAAVVSEDLRTQYRIGYVTKPRQTNEWREVMVDAIRKGESLITRSRSGYFVPKAP